MRMFYVHLNGQQQGPYDEATLWRMNLAPNTPVWCKGMRDWAPISTLVPMMDNAPQPQPRRRNGTIVQMAQGPLQRQQAQQTAQQQRPVQQPQRPAQPQPERQGTQHWQQPAQQGTQHWQQPVQPQTPPVSQPVVHQAVQGGTVTPSESGTMAAKPQNHDAIVSNALNAQESSPVHEHLSLWGYYKKCWSNYATFRGRARRTEYWSFALFNFLMPLFFFIGGLLLTIIGCVLFTDQGAGLLIALPLFMPIFGVVSFLYSLAAFIPGLAVISRRLHDTGKGFGWFFIILLPLIGAIVLLVFFLMGSEPQTNRFGPNPKA